MAELRPVRSGCPTDTRRAPISERAVNAKEAF